MAKVKELLEKIFTALDDGVHRPWLEEMVKNTPNKIDDLVLGGAQALLDYLAAEFKSEPKKK